MIPMSVAEVLRPSPNERVCPGGPDWSCDSLADPGDRYCGPCRDAVDRIVEAETADARDGYDPAEPWMEN